MPQSWYIGQILLRPLRRKACWGFFTSEKIQRLRPGLNPQTWVPEASMLTTRPPKPSSWPMTGWNLPMNAMRKAECRNLILFEVCVNVKKRQCVYTVYLVVVPLLHLNVEIILNSCYCFREISRSCWINENGVVWIFGVCNRDDDYEKLHGGEG